MSFFRALSSPLTTRWSLSVAASPPATAAHPNAQAQSARSPSKRRNRAQAVSSRNRKQRSEFVDRNRSATRHHRQHHLSHHRRQHRSVVALETRWIQSLNVSTRCWTNRACWTTHSNQRQQQQLRRREISSKIKEKFASIFFCSFY